jgi:hypothetical protein
MPVPVFIDFSRPPTERERSVFERRHRRLNLLAGSVEKAQNALLRVSDKSKLGSHLWLRPQFIYRNEPAPPGSSDRALPAPEFRPPATRIMSPRGAALRFYIIAVAEAQTRYGPGTRPANTRELRPRTVDDVGWVDLLASPARASGKGQTRMGVQDKKLRQLQSALQRLAEVGLVELPQHDQPSGKYEGFRLHQEGGSRAVGDPLPYTVPKKNEVVVDLPQGLITNGWIHILEDTEIALLLMVACRHGSLPNEEDVAIPADVRLLHYGIGRDAYDAHVMLSRLDLLEVKAPGRHLDGKVQDYRDGEVPALHRLKLLSDGFEQDAVETLRKQLEYQLSRRG